MKLIEGFDSNYRYILVAARRARQLAVRCASGGRYQLPQALPHRAGRNPRRQSEMGDA